MKKAIKIIVCILIIGLTAGLIYTTMQLTERNEIIDKLEEENEELKDEIEDLEKDVDELDYNLSIYQETFGSNIDTDEEEKEESTGTVVEKEEEYSNIKKVSMKQLKKMIEKEEDFILLISHASCSHCISYKPVFNETLSDNNLIGYELDMATLNGEEYEEFDEIFPTVDGTPTTLFFKEGKEISEDSRVIGSQDKETIIEAFKENGFIK